MSEPLGIVCIHGAGLDSSVWDELRSELTVPALAVQFPGRGADGKANQALLLEDYVRSAAEQIRAWNRSGFILVGHSIGAVVGLKLAAQFKAELKGFVAIGAVVPASGESFVSALPVPQRWIMPLLLKLFGTKPPPSAITAELCNDLGPEHTQQVVDGFTPEARALYTTRVTYELPVVQRVYITLADDRSIPMPLQQRMASNLQAHKVRSLASGHLAMLSRPKELAALLMEHMTGEL